MRLAQRRDQCRVVIRGIGLARDDRATPTTERQRDRDGDHAVMVSICNVLLPSDPRSDRARQIRGHNQVDGAMPKMDGLQDAVAVLAGEQSLECCLHQLLDRGCRNAVQFAISAPPPLNRRRHVVPVEPSRASTRVRRAHRLADCIEQSSSQHGTLGPTFCRDTAGHAVGRKMLLDALEQLSIDDRRVLALVDQVLVHDLAEVDAIAQEVEQRAATERRAAQFATAAGDMPFRQDPVAGKGGRETMDRSDRKVSLVDGANELCLGLVYLPPRREPYTKSH